MKLQPKQTLLFIGDSITDCDRPRPHGENIAWCGLGQGYVSLVDALLGVEYPDVVLSVKNTGINGNRVIDLEKRWTEDVLAHKPDWLSIMIGINDVWRQFDSPTIEQVDIVKFEKVYRSLIEKTLPSLKGLVLMTPFLIEPNINDPMRAMMSEYGAVTEKLAGEYGAVFVDTQAAFDAFLEHRSNMTLCADRVHPNMVGHMILARAFVRAIQG
ncbi:MAG: SGNH/GDSL hydrolase family protein [Opitutales bacterium]